MIDKKDIFNIRSEVEFNEITLKIFKHQFENNKVYRSFCDLLYKHPSEVKKIEDIPFLPIQFFKSYNVVSSNQEAQTIFTSSGTTGQVRSKHLVTDLSVYEESFQKGFKYFYEDAKNYAILGLLPSYLERKGSSLVYMVNSMIENSSHQKSGFYLNNLEDLKNTLQFLEAQNQKTLLIGVSFALLDFVECYSIQLNNTIIMETGGMKGHRKELIRRELHNKLKAGFGVDKIHSEYGMTELLSQAYSKGEGVFKTPPWMKVLTRDPEDALSIQRQGKTGGINIIDLANFNSCSFVATQDLGKVYSDESFEILGRFDESDIRGCNLMII